ncbi:hypothetical protein Bbelb_376710 [Branchiostoma belcheri]|nr:hypothetical protein Bbelb_376710 [Branchiostoma belcheri]
MPATRSQRRSGGGAADDPPPAVTTVSRKQPKKPKKPTAAGQIKDIQAQLSALTSVTETLQQSLATIAARPPAPPAPPHPTLPPAPHPTLPPAHLENLQPPPTDSLVSNILGTGGTDISASKTTSPAPVLSPTVTYTSPTTSPPSTSPYHIPLDTGIPATLKEKIWQNKYIDFKSLLPNMRSTPQYTVSLSDNLTPTLTLANRPPDPKHDLSLDQWTKAFLIYHFIYAQRHPAHTCQLVSYLSLVRTMASRGAQWRRYDEMFRKYREGAPDTPWDPPLLQLYMDAHYNNPSSSLSRPTSSASTPPNPPSDIPPGYCFRFHKENGQCRRVQCPFKHECFKCDGRHKATLCDSKSPSPKDTHFNIIQDKLQNELVSERVAGPFSSPPFKNLFLSPLYAVPKKAPGKFRLIHDLSYPPGFSVNSGIPSELSSVKYATIDNAIQHIKVLGRGCFLAKTDIEAAFRLIPVHPNDYHLLGFYWNGNFYYDRAFLRRLIDLTKPRPGNSNRIPIPTEVRQDLRMWLTFLNSYNGRSFFLDDVFASNITLHLYTDAAASLGYGGRPFPARIPEYGPSSNPCPATPAAARIDRTVTDLLSSALAPSTIDVLGEDLATPPVSTNLLAQFIGFLHNEGFAPPTISSKLSAISFVHKLLELPDPAQSFFIQKLLHATRKSHPPDNRRPITPSILKSLIDSLPEVYAPAYDRQLYKAMFLFTFYSLARVGEVTVTGSAHHTLQLSDVNLQGTSHQTVPPLLITFRTYKHSSTKRPVTVSIVPHPGSSYCPVANLKSYLSLRGECAGCLFLLSDGRPVSSDHFSNTLRKCLERAHLDPQAYTAHSFRIGAATHAASSGASDAQLRALGRWSSDAFKSYIRP